MLIHLNVSQQAYSSPHWRTPWLLTSSGNFMISKSQITIKNVIRICVWLSCTYTFSVYFCKQEGAWHWTLFFFSNYFLFVLLGIGLLSEEFIHNWLREGSLFFRHGLLRDYPGTSRCSYTQEYPGNTKWILQCINPAHDVEKVKCFGI